MTPEPKSDQGQGTSSHDVQSPTPGISRAAQFYMSLTAEAPPGAGPAGTVTPPAPGSGDQGGGDAGSTPPADGGGFNWDLFPDVPEDQRPLLEPHLKRVQGHVTQLEQKSAPFKQLADAGLDAQTVQGILNLDASFKKDPSGTWVQMGREMQQQGTLPDTLDIDAVQKILAGEDVEETAPPAEGGSAGDEEKPAWALELDQRLTQREKEDQARVQQEQQAKQNQELDKALEGMQSQLKEAGLSDAEVEKADLIGALISTQGDPDKAIQKVIDFWSAARGGLTDKPKPDSEESELDAPKGAPEVPDTGLRGRGRSSAFAEANKGALQFLKRSKAGS